MKDALGAVQSILVLGGTSDIARATCRALVADRTKTVVLAGRSLATLDPVADELRAAGAERVETITFDAHATDTHEKTVADAFACAGDGDIDVVLVAFGLLGKQETAERDVTAALDLIDTNYRGVVSVTMPIVERLRAQGHGTLVLLSSVAGERVRRSLFVYGSTKAAIDSYYQGLADSLAGTGVHVMIVRPGFVHTKMTEGLKPAPLSTTADAVAASIVTGLRRNSAIVWSPAPLRLVMSILRHLPRSIFRRLPG